MKRISDSELVEMECRLHPPLRRDMETRRLLLALREAYQEIDCSLAKTDWRSCVRCGVVWPFPSVTSDITCPRCLTHSLTLARQRIASLEQELDGRRARTAFGAQPSTAAVTTTSINSDICAGCWGEIVPGVPHACKTG